MLFLVSMMRQQTSCAPQNSIQPAFVIGAEAAQRLAGMPVLAEMPTGRRDI